MCVFDDLPPPIVAGLHALGQRMHDHVLVHQDQALDVHEQGLLDACTPNGADC